MGQTPKAVDEVRGPERFFYDTSTYPASYALAREAVDIAARERSAAGSPPRGAPTQARVCVMCDHCWRAKRCTRRSDVVKCPTCLSDQPGDDELTEAELQEMEEKYATFERVLEKRRRDLMAAASNARSALKKRGYVFYAEDSTDSE